MTSAASGDQVVNECKIHSIKSALADVHNESVSGEITAAIGQAAFPDYYHSLEYAVSY